MNWKLIFQLSLFGLAMGAGTVFFIGSSIEPALWLVIFFLCAYIIARNHPHKPFAHGVFLGLANSVWVTGSHIMFFDRYIAGHQREAEMVKSMPLPDSPRLMMALVGPVIGIISGVIIGVLALIAVKLLKASRPTAK